MTTDRAVYYWARAISQIAPLNERITSQCSYELAMLATRAGNVFTTHTAVAAGFDLFHPDLIRKYLSRYAEAEFAISIDALLAMGRQNSQDALAWRSKSPYLSTALSKVAIGASPGRLRHERNSRFDLELSGIR